MTQVVVKLARAGEKYGSIELGPFCDQDKCDATILVSKDDAYFIHNLLNDGELTPPSPALIFWDFAKKIGARFSEVGVSPELGSMRITLMDGQVVQYVAHPGLVLQIALIGDLPIFYGEDEKEDTTKETVSAENVRERVLAALDRRKVRAGV